MDVEAPLEIGDDVGALMVALVMQGDGDVEVPEVLLALDHGEGAPDLLALGHVKLAAEEEPGLGPGYRGEYCAMVRND